MATIKEIKFKRTKTAGRVPTAATINEGEIALNLVDNKIFTNTGSEIVDLTLRSGGKVDGNLEVTGTLKAGKTTVGSLTSTDLKTGAIRSETSENTGLAKTGSLEVTTTITAGDIGGRNITASAGVVSNGDVISRNGVMRVQTTAGKNAHYWMEGLEGGSYKERALIYAPTQSETSGSMIVRVQNGYGAGQPAPTFVFTGDGRFTASTIQASRIVATDNLEATRVDTRQLNTSDKPWQAPNNNTGISYSFNDLPSYVPGTGGALALNYVYRGRAAAAGTIWHQVLDERSGAEWAVYTGAGPSNKMYSVQSQQGLGNGKFTGSLHVGGPTDTYSALGVNSIALGEANTGIRRTSAGYLDILANGEQLVRFGHPGKQTTFSTRVFISNSNAADTSILPPNNSAQLDIDTSLDDNGAGGNGRSLIGYNAAGEYHHYFRGKGATTFDMWKGVNINRGGITVNGDSTFNSPVTFNAASTSMNVASATNLTTSKNNSQVSASAMNAIWVHTPTGPAGGKTALRTFRGGNGDVIWHETIQGGALRYATGNTDALEQMKITSGGDLEVRNAITSNGGSIISNGGSFRTSSSGNCHYWLEDQNGKERGVIYAGPNSNTVVIRAQRTSDSTPQNASYTFFSDGTFRAPIVDAGRVTSFIMPQPPTSLSGIRIEGVTTGGEAGLIRGTVDGGGHVQWASRSAGIQLDCPNADSSAYNIWKATKWGAYHLGAMDIYGPNVNGIGNATMRLVLRRGGGGEGIYMWTAQGLTCPGTVTAVDFLKSSDAVLKKDIVDIESQSSKLHQVQIKRYALKDGSNDKAVGVIAQELEAVYPEFVGQNDEGVRHVDYIGLSSVLWKITQEQDLKLQSQQKELEDVSSRLAKLEALLTKTGQ